MTYIRPEILWALPFALVPIIIYYLMRFRSLDVKWGANYVLELALERLKKRLPWEQIVLLLLRTLAAAALVIAFARPAMQRMSATVSSSGVHRIILLDASHSMLAGDPLATSWQQGMAIVEELTRTWGRGESWSLYVAGAEQRWLVRHGSVTTHEATMAAMQELQPEESRISMRQALAAVLDGLGDQPTEIYIVADAQATTWADAAALPLPADPPVQLFWIAPPLPEGQNLAVTGVVPSHERLLVGHPAWAFVTVRNFSSQPASNVRVELLLDGAYHDQAFVSLLPGQSGRMSIPISFESPGTHSLEARLGSDLLSADNSMAAAVYVSERLRLVVLRDPGQSDKFASAYPFLDLAARVLRQEDNGTQLFSGGRLEVTVIEEAGGALHDYDVVVMDSGRTLTAELATQLRSYVEQGGGLVLAADETVVADEWNRYLGDAGLLPARLRRAQLTPLGGDRFQRLATSDHLAPAFRAFASGNALDWQGLRFHAWYELGEPDPENAIVLIPFTDEAPYAVAARRELGSVMLLASGLNARTNNLIASEAFYPFIMQLAAEAAGGAHYPRNLTPGSTVRLRLPSADGIKAVTLDMPDGTTRPLQVQRQGPGAVASLPGGVERTSLASLLVISDEGTRRIHIGIQGERLDSNLTLLTDAEAETLLERLRMTRVSTWPELTEELAAARLGREWHGYVMLLLLACLFGEMLLQRRFI